MEGQAGDARPARRPLRGAVSGIPALDSAGVGVEGVDPTVLPSVDNPPPSNTLGYSSVTVLMFYAQRKIATYWAR